MEESKVKKFRQLFRKGIAMVMAAATMLSVVPAVTGSAASEYATISFGYSYDGNGNIIYYQQTFSHNGRTAGSAGEAIKKIYANGEDAFCIEPGYPLNTGSSLQNSSSVWNALGTQKQKAINLALLYGAQGNRSGLSGTDDEKIIATQIIIWELVTDCRSTAAPYTRWDSKFYDGHCANGANSGVSTAYDQIIDAMQNHAVIPSFSSENANSDSLELEWDGSQYILKLTDTNDVLSKFNFTSSDSSVKVSRSGNTLTITSDKVVSGTIRLSASKSIPTVSSSAKLVAYGDSGLQDVVTGVENTDAVKAYVNVEIPYGHLKVVKTSEDGLVEGMKFHLSGMSRSGITVDEYALTDNTGVATFSNIPISGDTQYILEEVETADRYVVPAGKDVTVNWNEVTTAEVHNVLKKFRVTVTKTDRETGSPQGDATLAGAVYGIYDGDTLIDTYTTDSNGSFTTDYYICGDDWTIREITPSEGYLLDETSYHVGAEAASYTVELNDTSTDVTEQIIKGKISIIKHTDDGTTQIETPEAGAEFQIYLKSAGNYDSAAESERDILICDENGYAETKDLPYGVYTVHQTKGWEGRVMIEDFDVYISSDGEAYRYLINNELFESYIKVIKTDAETGNTIPLAGAGFQIYDGAGNLVTMQYTYPEVTTVDTFYTGSNGYLITPEELPCGNYTLVEVQAPYGYVLDSTPVAFTITEKQAEENDGVTVTVVEKEDVAQKGRILVTKTGENFSTVQASGESEEETLYSPVYEVTGQAGAVYEIIAAEDIVTPDGTVRASAGDVVDTITTGEDGTAESQELYLGKYQVLEKTAPEGFVLNQEIREVELIYAGQEISVTETSTAFYNERQKVSISLTKVLEQDETFGVGNQGEIQNAAFGLYAAEDLTAADGSVIPADGLIEIVYCSTEGTAVFQTDVPFGRYYVKEIAADQHYLLSDETYPVEFAYQGQDTELVSISVNEGKAIENELLRGRISGLKTDTEGKTLKGAKIGLFSEGTEEFTEKTAVLVAVSDEQGAFAFENIPYGTWIVREIESPEGYVLNSALHYVAVTEDEEVIEVELINREITGKLELTKKDVSDGKLLPNAGFRIKDEDGNIVATGMTDENGLAVFTLGYGKYTYQEYAAPEGYEIDEAEYPFEITEDGQIVKAIMTNEKTESTTDAPKTGDNAKTGIWIALCVAAAAGGISLGVVKLRKKKK